MTSFPSRSVIVFFVFLVWLNFAAAGGQVSLTSNVSLKPTVSANFVENAPVWHVY